MVPAQQLRPIVSFGLIPHRLRRCPETPSSYSLTALRLTNASVATQNPLRLSNRNAAVQKVRASAANMQDVTARIRKRIATKRSHLGRPALRWTTKQDIQLIDLVADTDVLWKDIAVAIAAENTEENFAPSSGTCRSRFTNITGLQIADFRIRDSDKREQRKKLSIQAFLTQRLRETFSKSTNPTPPIPDLAQITERHHFDRGGQSITTGINPVFSDGRYYGQPNYGDQATPDLSSPGLLSGAATTPADSSLANPTPIVETFTGRLASSDNLYPDHGDYINPTSLLQGTTTRPGKSLSHENAFMLENTYRANHHLQENPHGLVLPQSQELMNRVDDIRRPDEDSQNIHSLVHSPQQSGPLNAIRETSSAVPKLQTARTIAEKHASVEDRTFYPRGFLAHIKAGIRDSVPSLVSSGTRRSRWSFRRSSRIAPTLLLPSQLSSENISSGQNGQRICLSDDSVALLELLTHSTVPADQIAIGVSHLITGGADVNCRDARGQMPLHLALDRGLHRVCDILLKNGADVYAKTSDGAKLSEHGRAILYNSINNPRQYAAIKLCRHLIRVHNPPHQTTTNPGTEGPEMSPFQGINDLQSAVSVEPLNATRPNIDFGGFDNPVPSSIIPPLPEHSQRTDLHVPGFVSDFPHFEEPNLGNFERAGDPYSGGATTFPDAATGATQIAGFELPTDSYVPGPQAPLYSSTSHFPFPVGMDSGCQETLQTPLTFTSHLRRLQTGEIALLYILPTPPPPRPGLRLMLQGNAPVLSHAPHMIWMDPSSEVMESPTYGRMIAGDTLPTLFLDESASEFNGARRQGPASNSLTNYWVPELTQSPDTWQNNYLTNDPRS